MRINITTVYRGENPGCFLQAWALQKQLSNMEHDVYFRKYRFNNYTPFIKLVNFAKCCIRFKFKRARDLIIKNNDYKYFQRSVKCTDNTDSPDVFFWGSDTLWNFDDPYFAKHAHFFTGSDIDGAKKFAYSISVGSTLKENFLKYTDAIKCIQGFKRIAVRDEYTRDILLGIYPAEKIIKTIDPTMLLDRGEYIRCFDIENSIPPKSLVIYYFGTIPTPVWNAIYSFAREREIAIINLGLYGDCNADMSIVATPAKFISVFSKAKYVFTNTFHGCVFSTIFNKQFATDGIKKKKIEGFLEDFSLVDRVIYSPEDVEKVFERPIDYENVNSLIKEKRRQSIEYLETCIQEVKEHE